MVKRLDNKITQYKNGEWIITIIETDDMFNAQIENERFNHSYSMFGMPKKQVDGEITEQSFVEMVLNSMDEYIPDYLNEVEMLESYYEQLS